jgi:hypothetical protein
MSLAAATVRIWWLLVVGLVELRRAVLVAVAVRAV